MKLPLKIVVFNNSVLGFVAMEMKAGGYLVRHRAARHQLRTHRRGLRHHRYSRGESLRGGRSPAARIFHRRCWSLSSSPKGLAIPPQIKLEQAKGFSLYMLRAIISGRGDEVIELAKTNWLR